MVMIFTIFTSFHIHIHTPIIALLGVRLSSIRKNLSNQSRIDVDENTI